tara:strand:- start:2526 stop:2792 length:267 start_codon:yes stop_codon:yes gene_type:complete
MGRAIDMEKDIDSLKLKVEEIQNQVRGMVSKIDEISEKSSKTKHVDLGTCVTGVSKDESKEEKTNDEGNGKSNKSANPSKSKSSKKNK